MVEAKYTPPPVAEGIVTLTMSLSEARRFLELLGPLPGSGLGAVYAVYNTIERATRGVRA